MTPLTVGSRFAATALAVFTLALMALVLFSGTPAPARAQEATVQPDLTATYGAGVLTLTPAVPLPTATPFQDYLPGCWTQLDNPVQGDDFQQVNDIAGLASNDVWAVGTRRSGGQSQKTATFTLHWDGTRWTQVPSPNDGTGDNYLNSVAVISANDAWAVGYLGPFETGRTLAMHWDGKSWTIVLTPNPDLASYNGLSGVAAVAPNDVWAVGHYGNEHTLILHWDGARWTQVDSPNNHYADGTSGGEFRAVTAVAPNDVWAVGNLVAHWDGARWTRVETGFEAFSNSVAAPGPDDVWAVGSGTILHWDGTHWTNVPVPPDPNGFGVGASLQDVAVASRNDGWIIGYRTVEGHAWRIILHWDGAAWKEVRPRGDLNPNPSNMFNTVAAIGGEVWISGPSTYSPDKETSPLYRYTSGPCPSATPTATPVEKLNPPMPLPGSSSRTFPETGKTLNGIFLDYWQTHGGLMQQGYPISDLMGEVSDLNGNPYTVQYTERAVFEYHPEYQAPYNVLLSQLGTFEFRKRYPQGAPNQQPNTDPGSVGFKETGHRLGGRFLEYWQTHGGLMQQGYPISDEFSEVSALNGKTYRVQYFERAVFEYHTENQPPYDVLLSQLGRFRYDAKYSAATPTPTPSPTATPTARLIAHDIQRKAAANDRFLFWIDTNNAVYAYDSQENTQFLVSNRPGFKESLTCDDRVVAWLEGDVEGTASIRGYDVIDHRELTLVPETGPGKFGEGHMALDGAMLYYGGSIGGRYGIIARNWSTGQENLLVEGGYSPAQWGDVLLWGKEIAHCDPNGGHPPCWFEQALTMRKANHDALLTTAYGQSHFEQYAVDENRVVWVAPDLSGSGSPLHLYDVNSGADSVLSPQMANNPQIRGNLVAWAEQPQGQPGAVGPWSLLLYNLADKTTKTLLAGSPGLVQAQGIMGQKAVACTVGGQNYPVGPHGDLYLIDLGH